MIVPSNKSTKAHARKSMDSYVRMQDSARKLAEEADLSNEPEDLDTLTERYGGTLRRRAHANRVSQSKNVTKAINVLESVTINLLAQAAYAAFPADNEEKERFRSSIVSEATELFSSDVCSIHGKNPIIEALKEEVFSFGEAFDPSVPVEESGFVEYVTNEINKELHEDGSDLQVIMSTLIEEVRNRVIAGVSVGRQKAALVEEALQSKVSTIDKHDLNEEVAEYTLKKIKASMPASLMETCFILVAKEAVQNGAPLNEDSYKEQMSNTAVLYMTLIETAAAVELFGLPIDANALARKIK